MERDYYGAVIHSFELGPRHELKLEFDVRPATSTATDGSGSQRVMVRFGGISNFEEVALGFKELDTSESLHYLRDAPSSKPNRRLIEMEFDRTGRRIQIVAGHVQE